VQFPELYPLMVAGAGVQTPREVLLVPVEQVAGELEILALQLQILVGSIQAAEREAQAQTELIPQAAPVLSLSVTQISTQL
jgi:hypothetical protein